MPRDAGNDRGGSARSVLAGSYRRSRLPGMPSKQPLPLPSFGFLPRLACAGPAPP